MFIFINVRFMWYLINHYHMLNFMFSIFKCYKYNFKNYYKLVIYFFIFIIKTYINLNLLITKLFLQAYIYLLFYFEIKYCFFFSLPLILNIYIKYCIFLNIFFIECLNKNKKTSKNKRDIKTFSIKFNMKHTLFFLYYT